MTKVLELQLQHQSFQWLCRIDFLGERGYGFLWTWVQFLPLVWTAPQGIGGIPELSGSEHATPSRSIPIYTIPTSDSSSKLNHFFVDCFWTLDHGQILSSPGSVNLGGKLFGFLDSSHSVFSYFIQEDNWSVKLLNVFLSRCTQQIQWREGHEGASPSLKETAFLQESRVFVYEIFNNLREKDGRENPRSPRRGG